MDYKEIIAVLESVKRREIQHNNERNIKAVGATIAIITELNSWGITPYEAAHLAQARNEGRLVEVDSCESIGEILQQITEYIKDLESDNQRLRSCRKQIGGQRHDAQRI